MRRFRRILLSLPTTSQSMKSATALTVANVVRVLSADGIDVQLHNIDSAEIVTARDMFANMVLHSPQFDSLLFIDSDMSFDPRLVQRMIALDEEFSAAAYTRRRLDLDAFLTAAQQGSDIRRAVAHASSFTLKPTWDDNPAAQIELRDGFCSVAAVGMGCALISKSVFTDMLTADLVKPRLDLNAGADRTCWSFFDPVEIDGVRLGEDYSFCHRWTGSLGRKLWVCADEEVTHIGHYDYRARFADLLQSTEPAEQ